MPESMIEGVDFVALPTRDLEKAIEFYGVTLGLRRTKYRPDRNFAEFAAGNLTINIMNSEKMGLEHVVSKNAIALRVDDMVAARQTLIEHGVEFVGDTFDTGVCYMSFLQTRMVIA